MPGEDKIVARANGGPPNQGSGGQSPKGVFAAINRLLDRAFVRLDALEQRPAPRDGKDGVAGGPGRDGLGFTSALIDADGRLVLTRSDGEIVTLARVVGSDGRDGRHAVDGKDGRDGRDADPELIARLVSEAVASLPAPKDGRDGTDGKDGRDGLDADPELIARLVSEAVASLPAPKDGRDGTDGKDGRDGRDADPELIARLVSEAVASLPAPKDGRDGTDGKDGRDGRDATDGKDGRDGRDGRSIVSGAVNEFGHLLLRLTDAQEIDVGCVIGPAGAAGKDGRDGADGKDGRDGADGKPGPRGATGKDGTAGKDGVSATAAEIDLGPARPGNIEARDLGALYVRDLVVNGETFQVLCRS